MNLLTAKEASIHLDVSTRTLWELLRRGRVACYRVGPKGGRTRFAAEDLDKYLASCRQVGERRA